MPTGASFDHDLARTRTDRGGNTDITALRELPRWYRGTRSSGRQCGSGGVALQETDAQLVERAQRGEQQAFGELVRRYQDVAFRVAYVITGSAEEAEDAAQNAFVRAYRGIDRFRPDAPFRPWLLTIVANAARTGRGRAKRVHSLFFGSGSGEEFLVDDSASPESHALAQEAIAEIRASLRRLPPDDQRVIALRFFLELSESEMAEVLNCPRGTVKSRLSRAMGRLRMNVSDHVPGAGND